MPNLEKIGGIVAAPVVLNQVDAIYTDEARRAKINGSVLVSAIINEQGLPRLVRVIRPIGYGLDGRALEVVRKYRFTPAMKQGRPVAVMISIVVSFRIY